MKLAMGVLCELGTDGHDASELLMELDGIMDPVDQN